MLNKPKLIAKMIKYQPISKIDSNKFTEDLRESPLTPASSSDPVILVNLYNSEVLKLLDAHAPQKTKVIVERVDCKRFTSELGKLKCE